MGVLVVWAAVWFCFQQPPVDHNIWLWTLLAAVAIDLPVGLGLRPRKLVRARSGRPQ